MPADPDDAPLATGPAGETAEMPTVAAGAADAGSGADPGRSADTVQMEVAGPGDGARAEPGAQDAAAGNRTRNTGAQAVRQDNVTAEAGDDGHVRTPDTGSLAGPDEMGTQPGQAGDADMAAGPAREMGAVAGRVGETGAADAAGEAAGDAGGEAAGDAGGPVRQRARRSRLGSSWLGSSWLGSPWLGSSWLGATRLGRHGRATAFRVTTGPSRPEPSPTGLSRPEPSLMATGTTFSWLTLVPVLLVIAWLLPAIPLLLGGSFAVAPMLVISVPLALLLIAVGLRRVPGRWPVSAQASPGPGSPAPLWSVLATVAVAAGFTAWQIVMRSQALAVTRDPGVYLQFGYWIAQHGSASIPAPAAAFGGAHPGLGFGSVGFIQHAGTVSPAFMAGLSSMLAAGFWAGGTGAALLVPPVLGGFAVLTFGGLTGRLAGTRWAPAGALVLALALPEQYTSRSAFAEPLTQILLFGGLCLVIDAMTVPAEPPAPVSAFRQRWGLAAPPSAPAALAALGGLALGLTSVAWIGGLSIALPAVVLIGVMLAGRRPHWLPFGVGLIVGVGYGLADGYLLARPYLDSLASWTGPFAIIAGGVVVVALDAALVWRYAGLSRFSGPALAARPLRWLLRWLPEAVAGLTVLVAIGFAIRPYVQTVRDRNPGEIAYVGYLQRLAGLPLDPRRLYAEDTLYWVIWYIGLPALLLGVFGLALLARRVTRALLTWSDPTGAARLWALPLLIIGWVTVTVLWRPGIIPDQPWASRRLVPVVLPGLILAAVWAVAWLNGRAAVRGAGRGLSSAVVVLCVAALLLPTTLTTFGVGVSGAGQSQRGPASGGVALQPAGAGEVNAVGRLCASLGPGAAVLIVDPRVASQFTQLIRGMCDVPVARMDRPRVSAVRPVLAGMARAHRRPVLLGASAREVAGFGGAPHQVLNVATTQDAHVLTHPPTGTWWVRRVIWMSRLG